MNINESRVREFAYQIWESEGKPHGQAMRHWEMACKLAETQSMNEDDTFEPVAVQADKPARKSRSKAPQAASSADEKTSAKTPRQKKAKVLKDTLETEMPRV